MKQRFKDLFLHFHSAGALPATLSWFRETNPLVAMYAPIEDMVSSAPSSVGDYNRTHKRCNLGYTRST